MENTLEAPMPVDDESNRLGELILSLNGYKIYKYTRRHGDLVFFAWGEERRGHPFPSLEEAAQFLGLRKPKGYADYEGKVRLGKLMEKFSKGEIWKYATASGNYAQYFVHWNHGSCEQADNLIDARRIAEVNTMSVKMSPPTRPKSEYPQNQKGYRHDSYSAKKKG